MIRIVLHLIFLILLVGELSAQPSYTEMYRPQYHASPRNGFMGDPNGPIKFNGDYHLFWWGHLRSKDMVHWQDINSNALNGTPSGFGNWSGSVVVDFDNTAGFNTENDTAMIAVYTLNDNATGNQSQAISISLNHGSFDYYEGNPVIEGNEPDFRDPQVFWHAPTGKWVMVITKPVDRGIQIYDSDDLKNWTYKSTFDGVGARKEVWEVPDLFQLPLNGDVNNMKWVMTCGMGPNKMQFWVGDFDGTTFTLVQDENFYTGEQVAGVLFEDFENGYGDWSAEGTAFGNQPANGALPDQQEVMGFTGASLANSFLNGDSNIGKLISPEFIIEHAFINFQIGGGTAGNELGLRVVVNGETVQSVASTSNTEVMQWRGVDVSQYIGQSAHIEIVDDATNGWGHVLVDHIVFSNELYDTRIENANWADWGYDFYAGKTFRNYDSDDDRQIWLAWMGNWTYARDVPTKPWKGNQSLPRALSLVKGDYGYQLLQKPIEELKSLRTQEYSLPTGKVNGTQPLTGFAPEWNVYELELSFKIDARDQVFGISLAKSEKHEGIKVTYDAHTSVLELDRSGTPFSFAFRRISKAPIHFPKDSILNLHIYVDQASIEVFANDYETSISSLAFTDVLSTGISLFSENDPVELLLFKAWDLESIHGITPDQVEKPEIEGPEILNIEQPEKMFFPNPVKAGGKLTIAKNYQSCAVYDLAGNLIFKEQGLITGSTHIPEYLNPGIYILELNGAKTSRERLLVTK
ncbi:MAG: GH32 C-terminal domain-containing protein [Cyclobacteriaceae bacterium]